MPRAWRATTSDVKNTNSGRPWSVAASTIAPRIAPGSTSCQVSSAIGRPVVVGTSRKSFLGKLTGKDETERLAGTIATNVMALERGAQVFRVHDVAPVVDALKVAGATVRKALREELN